MQEYPERFFTQDLKQDFNGEVRGGVLEYLGRVANGAGVGEAAGFRG